MGGDAGAIFDSLKEGLAAPLSGMGISFSSSLFGLAGSLCSAFSTCRPARRRTAFYTDLRMAVDHGPRPRRHGRGAARAAAAPSGELRVAIERLREAITDGGSNRASTTAMANLAEAIQGLVQHMRTEQQMIRDWVDGQAEQHREIRRLLEILARESVNK